MTVEEIFHREAMPHTDSLYGAALRFTRSQRDAEDLVQDTLMKAWVHFDRYTPGTNCRAWLFRILTNTFINRYRRNQRDRVVLMDDDAARPLDERAVDPGSDELADRPGVDDETIGRLFGDEVSRALQHVPIDFRVPVILCDVYDFSYRECADIIEVPIGTIMSRLYRGRRILRAELAGYAVGEGLLRGISDEYREQIESDTGRTIDLASWRRAAGG